MPMSGFLRPMPTFFKAKNTGENAICHVLTLFLHPAPTTCGWSARAACSPSRSGSCLSAPRFSAAGRGIFISRPGRPERSSRCHPATPYEVRARGSERSRRVRFGTGPGALLSTFCELLPAATSRPARAHRRCHKRAVAPAKTFLIVGRGVAARARALTTVLTFLSIYHWRFEPAPGARRRSRRRQRVPRGRLARHQATLSTSAHNAIRAGCHHAIRVNDGSGTLLAAVLWSSKSPFLGWFSTKQSCACMLGWGPRHVNEGLPPW
eukprot:scaffold23993_cov59-Phaeocystis_antarctica.AAC.1